MALVYATALAARPFDLTLGLLGGALGFMLSPQGFATEQSNRAKSNLRHIQETFY